MPVREIAPRELADRLRQSDGEKPVVLDVRNPDEVRLASIPGAVNVPMHELPSRLDELEELRSRPIVVICHVGIRSWHAAAFLESVGFAASSLAGGIDRWALDVDPRMTRY
jgi:sulfur-carrier protein adenylyltransferase/sulfurtransferase